MISYQWFKENARTLTRPTHAAADFLSGFLDEETVTHFYPKKFIVPQTSVSEMEFIAVTNNALFVFQPVEESHIFMLGTVKHYKLSDISSLTLSADKNIRRAQLDLIFTNGDKVELNSHVDSNEDWEQEYTKVIVDIFKTLTRKAP